jgi:hypothetical protein
MGQPSLHSRRWIRSNSVRPKRRPKAFPEPRDDRLTLSPPPDNAASQWEEIAEPECVSESLPVENVAAIKLLDSWLSVPETDNSERADEMRRRIDENRLSDRKFFT